MIVSHKYKFVIAAINGLGAGPWLSRIAAEGEPGHLEIVGHPNSVVVPEGCYEYARFYVDAPYKRVHNLWHGRAGRPWEGPDGATFVEWCEWYMMAKPREYRVLASESSPNGWGMRATEGDWMWFEDDQTLCRTFAGIGNSPKGVVAPWGVKIPRIIDISEPWKGWRDIVKLVPGTGFEADSTRDLIKWHMAEMQTFYELPDEHVRTFERRGAWRFRDFKGIRAEFGA